MKFLVLVKANEQSEAGVMPDEKILTDMAKYNEELSKAGVLLDLAGLQPTSRATRVRFSGRERRVIDGPFSETKELIAGYWLVQTKTKEEAIEWVKRAPMQDTELEVRPLFELGDFDLTAEQKASFDSVEAQLKDQAKR